MKCFICYQELSDHTYSPVDHGLCVWCWTGWVETKKRLAVCVFQFQVQDAMKSFIEMVRSHDIPI